MNLEKKIVSVILFAIFLLNFSQMSMALVVDETTDPVGEIGSFYISDNSEKKLLLNDYYQAYVKDIKWSLTINVDANSSSNLVFTLFHNSGISTISGEKEFIIAPGQTRTFLYNHSYIYRSVVCSCEASPINFYYELADPTEGGSGNFQFLNTVYDSFPTSETKSTTPKGLDGFNAIITLFGILAISALVFKNKYLST